MIKVIVFDFFGVCVNNFPQQTADALLSKFSINKEEWKIFVSKAAAGLDTGKKEEIQFFEDIVRHFKLKCSAEDLSKQINDWDDQFLRVNEDLMKIIEKNLKNKFTIACFSNVSRELSDRMNTKNLYNIFDKIILSYQIGTVKKDPEAWKFIENKFSYKPDESMFIDDSEQNIKIAQARGWHTIHYKNDGVAEKILMEL